MIDRKLIITVRHFPILALLCSLFVHFAEAQTIENSNTYKNPVIAGDFPDPSIIRVGNIYYAVGTSCDFAPNYPIYQSSDLINWKRISSVFNEPPKWSSDDFWAPELYYSNGTFFVYYTTKRKDNHIACIGVATTKDIRKGFTDHGIIIEWGEEAIDAFVFLDDDGKLYITWKAYGLTKSRPIEILASELSKDGLTLVGEHFTLTDHKKGWKGAGDEGQCLIKHNGYYYLFYSIGGCCDNRCDYRVMIARSKNLKSGWEQFPEPILQGGKEWRCTGHGTLVTTPDNRYYYLYHSYNAKDFEFIGRQGLLDEVVWNNQTGWPYFKNGNTPSVETIVPLEKSKQERDSIFYDDFYSKANLPFWEWDVLAPKPSAEIVNGTLCLNTAQTGIGFLGLRPKTGDYRLTSSLIPTNEWSGIGIYSNQQNLLSLAVNNSELILYQIKKGEKSILAKELIGTNESLLLRYDAVDGRYFCFYYSKNGEDWLPIKVHDDKQVDGTFIAQWGFSPRIGFIFDGKDCTSAKYSSIKVEFKY